MKVVGSVKIETLESQTSARNSSLGPRWPKGEDGGYRDLLCAVGCRLRGAKLSPVTMGECISKLNRRAGSFTCRG